MNSDFVSKHFDLIIPQIKVAKNDSALWDRHKLLVNTCDTVHLLHPTCQIVITTEYANTFPSPCYNPSMATMNPIPSPGMAEREEARLHPSSANYKLFLHEHKEWERL